MSNNKIKILSYLITSLIALALLGSLICFNKAYAAGLWADENAKQMSNANNVYNDGAFKATSKIEALVSGAYDEVNVKEKITLTNLSDTKPIIVDKTSIRINEGFESVGLGNWKIYNDTETLFDGDANTEFTSNINLECGQSKEFGVSSNLKCRDVLSLVDTVPFKFVYEYHEGSPVNYFYAVTIWGINQDGENTVTFGPATGSSSACLDVDGKHEHCIHNESWDEIITNIKNGHADWYQECLDKACTKDVALSNNKTIMNYPTSFTRCSCLYDNIIGKGRYFEDSSTSYTCFNNYCKKIWDPEIANWASSWMRATLNGRNNKWEPFELSEYAIKDSKGKTHEPCTKDNCLLSSFPEVLQEAIIPKEYEIATNWEGNEIISSDIVKDKLWLPSTIEIYGPLTDRYLKSIYLNDFGEKYKKMENLNMKWTSYSVLEGITPLNTIKEKDSSMFYGRIACWRLRTSIKDGYFALDPGVTVMCEDYLADTFDSYDLEVDVGDGSSGLCPCFVVGFNN